MILGDSLQVMASLANREGLRGKVQAIYMDPPYGIKFNSNFQWSTTTRDVRDGKSESMTREPEMVKAFRDTWKYGIHSYLSYLRDRLIIAKDLLIETGSIFLQISDENCARVRILMDEVFGEENFISQIAYATTTGFESKFLSREGDNILWYAKDINQTKFNHLFKKRNTLKEDELYKFVMENDLTIRDLSENERNDANLINKGVKVFRKGDPTSQGAASNPEPFVYQGRTYYPNKGRHWTSGVQGLARLAKARRISTTKKSLCLLRFVNDNPLQRITSRWDDTGTGSFTDEKIYVVQTGNKVITRCLLMATDPGDLVLDPTCGSGTTAFVAEQWGRRWITIDTSRVALALARTRLMSAIFPYYILKDSRSGQICASKNYNEPISVSKTANNIQHGFVYERVQRISIKDSITNNEEIDFIYDSFESKRKNILEKINAISEKKYAEWEIPRPNEKFPSSLNSLFKTWWNIAVECQQKIDKSIGNHSEFEYLLDKPYFDEDVVRVTGPFTIESLSPHRIISIDANKDSSDPMSSEQNGEAKDFAAMIIENLRTNGIQQSDKSGKLDFVSVEEFPGDYLCAEGKYLEGNQERRAGILIGPEFGTLTKADIIAAAREAIDCGFNLLITCAFHFDAQSSDISKLGHLPIMKVMMNTDLMMGDALRGKGNLFVAFGEPDIVLEQCDNNQIQIRVRGIDIFFPNTGEVRSDNEDGIACWFVDTDYDQESFFVRQAYFLGAKNPYESLKKTLKAEINEDILESVHSNVSRPFPKPKSGYVAVKVINHLGDEVMKEFRV